MSSVAFPWCHFGHHSRRPNQMVVAVLRLWPHKGVTGLHDQAVGRVEAPAVTLHAVFMTSLTNFSLVFFIATACESTFSGAGF